MTAILSQMDDRHYATYIETFAGSSDLVVRVHTQTHLGTSVAYKPNTSSSPLAHLAVGLPDGVLPALQGPDWETRVPL